MTDDDRTADETGADENGADETGADEIAAGGFAAWLADIDAALRGERDAVVPCGRCTACCRSSQFVHIGPDEADTLRHVPLALRFPAPRLPRGHVLLGYDDHGRCPMLVDDRCSIYEHRPRACRTYDCRVFAAAGLDAADDGKVLVARQARRWRFEVESDDDLRHEAAVRAAAGFLRGHPSASPDGVTPTTTTQLAVLAVEARGAFIELDVATGEASVVAHPNVQAVRVELTRRRPTPGAPGRPSR